MLKALVLGFMNFFVRINKIPVFVHYINNPKREIFGVSNRKIIGGFEAISSDHNWGFEFVFDPSVSLEWVNDPLIAQSLIVDQ